MCFSMLHRASVVDECDATKAKLIEERWLHKMHFISQKLI